MASNMSGDALFQIERALAETKVADKLALLSCKQIAHAVVAGATELDAAAGRDAPRFHHECTASTFMTPTHVTYMVHACSAAVARATAKAARKYAHARAISHSVRENTLARPAVVQPTF